jgi:hypothetical protein
MAVAEEPESPKALPASRTGLRLMLIIVIGVASVAIYSNVQKSRRDKVETVTITPISTATPTAPGSGR